MNQGHESQRQEMQDGTRLPNEFFFELLPRLKDEVQLRLVLFALWAIEQQDEEEQYLFSEDFIKSPAWLWSSGKEKPGQGEIQAALQALLDQEILLGDKAKIENCTFLVIDSERGRELISAYRAGTWQPGKHGVNYHQERKNIFQLYEENIGPLTPLIADSLSRAEKEYSSVWVKEAIQTAVENNVRRWRYIERVLQNRKEDGRYAEPKRDYTESIQRYIDHE